MSRTVTYKCMANNTIDEKDGHDEMSLTFMVKSADAETTTAMGQKGIRNKIQSIIGTTCFDICHKMYDKSFLKVTFSLYS